MPMVRAGHALTPAPDPPVLEVRGLTKRYGRRVVLRDLSITLERGQVLGLLGPNGAGKTTAICALLGLVRPDAGEIRVLGIDARRAAHQALRHVGALVESPTFYPYLSGWENLAILARLRSVPERQIAQALHLVGLPQAAHQRVGTYSLGMRQRLAIAAAILHEPALLVLDEPTNGLDPQGIVEVRELVRDLAAGGQTILLCSHVLAEVQQTCSHVLILARGETVATGALADLLTGNRTFRLRTPDWARLQAALQQLPWVQVLEENGELMRLLIPPDRHEAFSRLLVEHAIPVLELCREETTLEQFFLAMTEAEGTPSSETARRRPIWSRLRR
ncbi:ABC transporter ATP-binding protein [Thermomicrobium sp. 4228-Ro]|uniref:ABC transporter ATP-binding protein n=1 Tax=Thermomicrobium sp. 4228-Ro TaxID=2993937 RepID=UPI0022490D05|nr:ABC transporter ATP-binding protein [Thermomicrobium sp. 4228-Ro]MCX2727157.1 ABC transporter ATP-binding protein [Thermomicrobium sp. 4228-Ro]